MLIKQRELTDFVENEKQNSNIPFINQVCELWQKHRCFSKYKFLVLLTKIKKLSVTTDKILYSQSQIIK